MILPFPLKFKLTWIFDDFCHCIILINFLADIFPIIFHRHYTSSANIKVKDIVVQLSPTLKVLRVIFDNLLQWDKQVEKVTKGNKKISPIIDNNKKTFYQTRNFNPGYLTLFFKVMLW